MLMKLTAEQYKLAEIPIAKIGNTVLAFFQHLQRTMVEPDQRPWMSHTSNSL
jgi:hypothetical protein